MGTINVETTTGLEYKLNSIGTYSSVSLDSVRGLDDHCPTTRMPSGNRGRSKIRRRFNTENSFHDNVISLSQINKSLNYLLVHKWKFL